MTTSVIKTSKPSSRQPSGAEYVQMQPQPSWVFELEDDGTVVYSRPSLDPANELEGHNFFDGGFGFEDISRCRHHFRSFINSNKAAASFVWRRSSAGKSEDAKVLMTRAYRTGSSPSGLVMMEIRGCRN
jgi:hypothetical protein